MKHSLNQVVPPYKAGDQCATVIEACATSRGRLHVSSPCSVACIITASQIKECFVIKAYNPGKPQCYLKPIYCFTYCMCVFRFADIDVSAQRRSLLPAAW